MELELLSQFLFQFERSSPLFLLIFLGFALAKWFGFSKAAGNILARFAFNIALPAMLFRLLSDLFTKENHADLRLLLAYFGACIILFFYRTPCCQESSLNASGRFCYFRYRLCIF